MVEAELSASQVTREIDVLGAGLRTSTIGKASPSSGPRIVGLRARCDAHQVRDRDPRLAFLQDANDLTLCEPGFPHGDSFQSARKSNILWSGSRGSVPTLLVEGLAHLDAEELVEDDPVEALDEAVGQGFRTLVRQCSMPLKLRYTSLGVPAGTAGISPLSVRCGDAPLLVADSVYPGSHLWHHSGILYEVKSAIRRSTRLNSSLPPPPP